MATATIGQLTLATSALDADLIEFQIASSGLSRRITKANFIGATLTGGGAIATGGFTFTIPATGTASLLETAQTISGLKTFSANNIFNGNQTFNGTNNFVGQVTLSATQINLPSQFILSVATISLADDTAVQISVGTAGIILVGNTALTNQAALINFRATAGPYVNIMAQSGSVFEASTSTLTGTTGTDGKITVSATSGGNVYIENRTGATLASLRILRVL